MAQLRGCSFLFVTEERERHALVSRYGDVGWGSWLPIHPPTTKQPPRHCSFIGSLKHRQKVFLTNETFAYIHIFILYTKKKKKLLHCNLHAHLISYFVIQIHTHTRIYDLSSSVIHLVQYF